VGRQASVPSHHFHDFTVGIVIGNVVNTVPINLITVEVKRLRRVMCSPDIPATVFSILLVLCIKDGWAVDDVSKP
jgi:hypothetical protein